MNVETLDVEHALSGLKDFQRRTVDHVFKRMWLDDPPTPRFLVADEVGLGKTLVARGVIARTLAHLRTSVERIDVVYVCSNGAIAQQNVNRLNVLGDAHFASATRLTLLPLQLGALDQNRVNFVSFTPGTAFDLKSKGGIWKERVVLYRLLLDELPHLGRSLLHVMRAYMGLDRFEYEVKAQTAELNAALRGDFIDWLRGETHVLDRIHAVCDRFLHPRDEIPWEDREHQLHLIGELRHILAKVCVSALEPDLVILDEFQRFRDLLDGEDDAAELARELMQYTTPEGNDVRVLLLSATPYKPLTLSSDEEDHHRDFLQTLRFLFNEDRKVETLAEQLRVYRQALYSGEGGQDLENARASVERMLRSVMVRTERVGRTRAQDSMMETVPLAARVEPRDLAEVRGVSEVSRLLGTAEPTEYWKSAPYLLQFMKDYQLKRKLRDVAADPPAGLVEAVRPPDSHSLSRSKIGRYGELDPANGRLRSLMEEMVDPGQWRLLWMPPSLPYMEPGGAYREVPDFTKALVFSFWTVVPDAISAVVSYEVERRMVAGAGQTFRYPQLAKTWRQLLRFQEREGRYSGMTPLALMYPSVALAETVDPLRIAQEVGGGGPAAGDAVRVVARTTIEAQLRATGLWPRTAAGPADQRWYWASLAILDRPHLDGLRAWITAANGWRDALAGDDDDEGLRKHVEYFRAVAEGAIDDDLGSPPDDLLDVLADLALGSPAICARRALARVVHDGEGSRRDLARSAAVVAGGFRTLFNLPETIALLRSDDDDAYWRLCLQEAIEGNLQAVLDEYAHQLRESLGLTNHEPGEVVRGVGRAMAEALSLRTAPIAADDLRVTRAGRIRFRRYRLRTRYALRFGDLRDEDQKLARAGTVRAAFNSPFRPFILASTSVGQEGLDFHPYCHAVYHWNLPSNPVDLEQREGRVHRYKGHAVRKNVALRWGGELLDGRLNASSDPWQAMFQAATEDRLPEANDLVPHWIYEVPGGARVQRRVPMFPLSREEGKLAWLRRGLAVYRLAFGQPRQEDLLEFLSGRRDGGVDSTGERMISLEPEG